MTRGVVTFHDSASRIAEELPIRLAEFKVSNHFLLVIVTRISYFALPVDDRGVRLQERNRMQHPSKPRVSTGDNTGKANLMDSLCLARSKITPLFGLVYPSPTGMLSG